MLSEGPESPAVALNNTSVNSTEARSNFFGKVIVFFEYPAKISEIEGGESHLEHLTDPSDIIWENIGLQK